MKRLTKRGNGLIDIGDEDSVTRCIQRLADYEDTGLAPEDIPMGLELANVACALNLLKKYEALGTLEGLKTLKEAEEQGLLVRPTERLALAMCAGARAIENNRRYESTAYVYDVFGVGKELSYREAAKLLREAAEKALQEANRND